MANAAILRPDELLSLGVPGTPYFYFDVDAARDALECGMHRWRQLLPRLEVAFCLKANPLPEVVASFARVGAWAEISCGVELDRALSSGVPGRRIIFGGPVKTDPELEAAIMSNCVVSVDAVAELARLQKVTTRLGQQTRILLRLSLKRERAWSRFGLLPEEIGTALTIIEGSQLQLDGIAMHIGSSIGDPAVYGAALDMYTPFLQHIALCNSRSLIVDVGGGFLRAAGENSVEAVLRYLDSIAQWLRTCGINQKRLSIVLEPGRILVEDFGVLVMAVLSVKRRNGRNLLFVNASSSMLSDALRRGPSISFVGRSSMDTRYSLYGTLCVENDLICEELVGPRDVVAGATLLVDRVGAYDMSNRPSWMRGGAPAIGMYEGQQVRLKY